MFDEARDLQAEALLELCDGAVNAALASKLKARAIQSHFAVPVIAPDIFAKLPDLDPPVLCIYRGSEVAKQVTMSRLEQEVTFIADYIPPPAARDEVVARWALLQLVWGACRKVILKGHSPDVHDDARILDAAGFRYVDPSTFKVSYSDTAFAGNEVLQWFRAEFTVLCRDPDDCNPQVIIPLLSLDAKYHIPGATDDAVDPIVEDVAFPPEQEP